MSLTVGGRLKALSGLAGATVGQMLQAIGSGATMAQCLVSYSGLASGTVAEHLLAEPQPDIGASEYYGGGSGLGRRRGGPWQDLDQVLKIRQHDTEDDLLLILL